MEKTLSILDADFINHICTVNNEHFFTDFMTSLNIKPAVAWYVAREELLSCQKAHELINNGELTIIKPEDFLEEEDQRELFCINVRRIANEVNEAQLPENVDIFDDNFHFSGKNLGEIISEMIAKEMNISLFASNDWGAKRYAQIYINSSLYKLNVYNMAELLNIIGNSDNKLEWKDIKYLLSDDRWAKDKEKLRKLWIKDK